MCFSLQAAPRERHYKGVVLDAQTRLPVANAKVEAYDEPFAGLFVVPRPVIVAQTTSRKDGSFELGVPVGQAKPGYLSVNVKEFRVRKANRFYKGQPYSYGGLFDRPSERRLNTVLIKKVYAQ